jgi:hypothetical protein
MNTITLNEERPSFLDTPICYRKCCINYDSSDIYNIDYEFDQCFGDKPYLKKYFQMYQFTKNQITTLFYKMPRFNICDAITYVSNCHCCGNKLKYGEIYELFEWRVYKQLVCSKKCEIKMRDERTQCYFGNSCKMCRNIYITCDTCDTCECYICNIDGDDEVNHFNRLHDTCFDTEKYQKLKNYAKINIVTLRDAIKYSQSCHACGFYYLDSGECSMYGDTYCCDECETNVEVYQKECRYSAGYLYHDDMECNICLNPDKTGAFNTRYNVDFDDDSIKEIKYYARIYEMTIRDAIDYYNNKYKDNEILLTTEDAGILEDEDDFNIIGPATKTGQFDNEIWDEIEDFDGDVYYLRKGFYRCVSSGPPAPRHGLDWYEIGGNFYLVNKVKNVEKE